MYYFFAALLFFGFLILTVSGENGWGGKNPRILFFINLGLAAAGVLITASVFLAAYSSIFRSGFDADFSGWAWDMLTVFYRISGIPAAVFFLLGTAAFLVAAADPKQCLGFPMKLRLAVTVVFSVIPLFLAPIYAILTVNERIALDAYVLWTGCGEALLLRAPLLIEYGRRIRRTPDISVTGK